MASLTDRHGNNVKVQVDNQRNAFTASLDSGKEAGRAFFLDNQKGERIFYHTEVDEEFSGRGIGSALVNESLRNSQENGIPVVPICNMFVKQLEKNGDEYEKNGGKYRVATKEDYSMVSSLPSNSANDNT